MLARTVSGGAKCPAMDFVFSKPAQKKGPIPRRVTTGTGPEGYRYAAARSTGIPILRALSTRLLVMPEPGKATRPFGRKLSRTSLRRKGATLPSRPQSGLHTTWWTPFFSAQLAAIFSAPGPPPCSSTMSSYLILMLSSERQMAVTSAKSLPPVRATRVPSGRCAEVSRSLLGAQVVAGVDGGRGEFAGLAAVGPVARTPGLAGLGTVSLGGGVAHGLEGVAPVAEVLDPIGEALKFAGLDLGAVLLALEVFHFGRDLVDAAVEALDLGVQCIDEAPKQALTFVGELRAVRCDGAGQDADGFLDPGKGLFLVPDLPIVELIRARGRAEQGGLFATYMRSVTTFRC